VRPAGRTHLDAEIERAFAQFRTDPWQSRAVMIHTMMLALEMANRDPKLAPRLEEMLREPFSVFILDEYRMFSLLQVAAIIDYQHGAKVLELWEPHVPWKEKILRYRKESYEDSDYPLAQKAAKDLEAFLKNSKQQSLFP
jgi:hypothetical protein